MKKSFSKNLVNEFEIDENQLEIGGAWTSTSTDFLLYCGVVTILLFCPV